MPWQTLLIANPGRGKNPYSSKDVPRFTKSATTPRKKRQWLHVYEGARKAGFSEARAIQQASGVVKGRGRNPLTRLNQNLLTDAIAGDIANKVAGKVAGMFTSHSRKRSPSRRKKTLKRKRRNSEYSLFGTGAGKPRAKKRTIGGMLGIEGFYPKATRKSVGRHIRKVRKKTKRKYYAGFAMNPHLALIGANPRARRRYKTYEGKQKPLWSQGGPGHGGGKLQVGFLSRHGSKAVRKSIRRHKKKTSGIFLNPRKRKRFGTKIYGGPWGSKGTLFGGTSRTRRSAEKRRRKLYRVTKRKVKVLKLNPRRKRKTWTVTGTRGSGHDILGGYRTKRSAEKRRRKAIRSGRYSKTTLYSFLNPRKKPMAKRKRRNPARDSKGRFLKAASRKRNRRTSISRRRRNTLAAPRRRRRNKTRVITRIKYRTRRVANVAKRRRRKAVRRHTRRRNVALVPKRRRRNPGARRGRRRSYRRSYRRRRNAGLGGLVGRVNFMQVAEVGIGVLAGDKITTYLGNTVAGWLGLTDATTVGLVKTGLGVVTAGLVWRFRPALGLGIAVGAVNGLINQYVFTPLWGMATPYLPGGMAGLKEYVNRDWRIDNWLAQGGGGAAVAGIGSNSLNRSSL